MLSILYKIIIIAHGMQKVVHDLSTRSLSMDLRIQTTILIIDDKCYNNLCLSSEKKKDTIYASQHQKINSLFILFLLKNKTSSSYESTHRPQGSRGKIQVVLEQCSDLSHRGWTSHVGPTMRPTFYVRAQNIAPVLCKITLEANSKFKNWRKQGIMLRMFNIILTKK